MIEHLEKPYVDRKDVEHHYGRRLYAAKIMTLRKQEKKALKYDGLTGCTFEVTRTGPRDARVGSDFDFEGRASIEEIAAELEMPEDDVPAKYEDETTYYTADEMVEMGIGKKAKVIGGGKKTGRPSAGKAADNL